MPASRQLDPSAGDIFGSGTLSGPEPGQRACLLEITSGGKQPIDLQLDGGGTAGQRGYLLDGDTVVLRGWCQKEGVPFRIGFGECRVQVLPSLQP